MACWVAVDLTRQRLEIRNDAPSGSRDAPPPAADPDTLVHACAISSGLNGIGELDGSGCTPTGWHVVRAAIGEGNPRGAVYRGRRFTGEVFTPRLAAEHPERDWILTRILWLSGREPGINRGRNAAGQRVDSLRRYIYFHGTPASEPMGTPASHGCIRLRDEDLLCLYQHAPAGTPVLLHA
ncbi:L,D-transpeptidase [Cobetia marina]|uniref:L,D-transpeptidase n=1 Tax=Cobetia marina TaxID=28258 RepID=A0ABU9GHC2_COBMA